MRTSLIILGAAAALAAAPAALAQPTPLEERGMYVGDNHTNGSAVIVTDRYGTHPEGLPGYSPINRTGAADTRPAPRPDTRRHHWRSDRAALPD